MPVMLLQLNAGFIPYVIAILSQEMTFTVWPLDGMEGTKPLQTF